MDWLLPGEFTRCSVYECCLYCVKQWWPCFLSSILKGKHLRHSGSLAAPPSLMWYTMEKVPEAGAQTIHCQQGQEWSYVRYSVTAMSAFEKETWEKLTWMVPCCSRIMTSWKGSMSYNFRLFNLYIYGQGNKLRKSQYAFGCDSDRWTHTSARLHHLSVVALYTLRIALAWSSKMLSCRAQSQTRPCS